MQRKAVAECHLLTADDKDMRVLVSAWTSLDNEQQLRIRLVVEKELKRKGISKHRESS
jgi:hypothetical protein